MLFRSQANESIFVVTGPLLKDGLPVIGPSKVAVPNYYYKVLLDTIGPVKKGIGFILPNKSSSQPLSDYAVSIDDIETLTGIDFFPSLGSLQEKILESSFHFSEWDNSSESSGTTPKTQTGQFGRCKAITQKGSRCKRRAASSSGFCNQHNH